MKLALKSALALVAALSALAPAAGAATLYPFTLAYIPASLGEDSAKPLLGEPDDRYFGLGAEYVTYDLESYRLIDGLGQDFNVYEADTGVVEFNLADILVSADNITFFNVESTAAAALDLEDDEAHGAAAFRRSYDVGGAVTASGFSAFRYIRIAGTGSGVAGGFNGFDLDAIGIANFTELAEPSAAPEPAAWLLMLLGFGCAGGVLRQRRARPARLGAR